jgi:hypothetical protein
VLLPTFVTACGRPFSQRTTSRSLEASFKSRGIGESYLFSLQRQERKRPLEAGPVMPYCTVDPVPVPVPVNLQKTYVRTCHALIDPSDSRHPHHHSDARQKISASKPKSGRSHRSQQAIGHRPDQHTNSKTVVFVTFTFTMMSKVLLTALVASASAFAPATPGKLCSSLALFRLSCHSKSQLED